MQPATCRGVGWRVIKLSHPSPFLDLPIVLRAMLGRVGEWRLRGLFDDVVMFLLHRRVSMAIAQMERMVARFAAGRLWRRPAGVVADAITPGTLSDAADSRTGGGRVWPGQFGWLVRLAGWQAVGYREQLRHLLQTPDIVALLAAAPQAGRVLRPICRMLAIEAALLRPGVVVVARVARTPSVRPARARPAPVDWGRIPLPRGVLAAARRQGYGRKRDIFGKTD